MTGQLTRPHDIRRRGSCDGGRGDGARRGEKNIRSSGGAVGFTGGVPRKRTIDIGPRSHHSADSEGRGRRAPRLVNCPALAGTEHLLYPGDAPRATFGRGEGKRAVRFGRERGGLPAPSPSFSGHRLDRASAQQKTTGQDEIFLQVARRACWKPDSGVGSARPRYPTTALTEGRTSRN